MVSIKMHKGSLGMVASHVWWNHMMKLHMTLLTLC